MLRLALTLVVSLLAGLAPAAALADDATKARAKALFLEGKDHFAAQRLAKALNAFEQSNIVRPHPLMLFNIAQVYEAMEDLPRAIETLRKFNATDSADADSRSKLASLEQILGTWPEISLTSQPPGAAVRLGAADFSVRCTTPCTVRLPPERRSLFFDLAGHQPVERPVRFPAGQKASFPPVIMPPVLASVSFNTNPAGAQIVVDGHGTPGLAPFTQALPVGKHTARISLPGHKPANREFTLTAAHTPAAPLALAITLERGLAEGQLRVSVDRPGAEVILDEKLVGTTPLAGPITVEGGMHRLRVRAEGVDTHEEVVTVRAGETTETRVILSVTGGPGFSLNQRTVGYGLMGLGGAVLIGAAVTGNLALGASDDLDACRSSLTCARTQREVDLADDLRGQALTTDILLGAGVAVAVTGLALWLLSDSPNPEATAQHTKPRFTFSPHANGFAAGATFGFE